MKLNLGTKIPAAFGLDLSSSSLKLMQLASGKKGASVKGYGEAIIPKGTVINDAISDAQTFGYLLKSCLDKPAFGHFDGNYAVVSLPEAKSFVRVIQIPKMSETEADSAVPFEAESFIPLPIDQVYLDWQKIEDSDNISVLGANPDVIPLRPPAAHLGTDAKHVDADLPRSREAEADPSRLGRIEPDPSRFGKSFDRAEADKMNILIIASPREYIDKYLEILDKCDIQTTALEVESQSFHRAVVAKDSRETSLIVDISASHSSIAMVENGSLQFTSTVPLAGNSFTDAIAKSLGVSSTKAEEIKRKVGMANTAENPNIKTYLLPVLTGLAAEIKNIIKFHGEHSQRLVQKIWLTGGSAKLANMAEFLGSQFSDFPGLEIKLANPWGNVPNLKNPPLNELEALDFTTAIGLAMRGGGL
jgi:Tfp pilus assembly PilM family ATPase